MSAAEVGLGDSVVSGQVLSRLDDAEVVREVETAQVNLELAKLRLRQMNEPPTAAQIADAEAALKQMQASLERLIALPTEAEVAAADAAVEQARAALERLLAQATGADIAAADVGIEQARTALERLMTTPSPVVQAESELAGARSRDIMTQFVIEALTLCIAGGLMGIALGVGVSVAVTGSQVGGQDVITVVQPWSIAVAFVVAAVVGLLSGSYPAYRAARLDPIEALRME